ncbi:hypothetical protein CTM62_10870 [Prevotella intermedia]|uniref:Uncharacterized protein n=1 Tax=Prevotella intermedia TaxID=28131 RepID=A0A2D3LA13_PREIN|nr:hypothetical protein CTM62_10870 [Prevotella intermedia]
MKRGSRLNNKFVGAWNVIKQVSFSSFKFSMGDNKNFKIQLWSLHGVGGSKHSLKFRFVK